MKIIVKETTEKEVEITLPYYAFDVCYWYKIISEKEVIEVFLVSSKERFGIEKKDYIPNNVIPTGGVLINPLMRDKSCTEQEFNEKFNEVLNLINQSNK